MKRSFHFIRRCALYSPPGKSSRGFALIATITLMILLALLSIGLLTMATTQLRISEQTLHASEAKAQAKLALGIAIDRLQCELGPDQRISAGSGILDSSPETAEIDGVACPHWVGVWDSWDTWLNRQHSTRQISIDSTYNQGRTQMFRTWLISSPRKEDPKQFNTPKMGFRNGGRNISQLVELVGRGTLLADTEKKNIVRAGLVHVDDALPYASAKKISRYRKSLAWWVSAENQKVRINLPKFDSDNTSELSILQSTWDTPQPNLESIDELDSITKQLPDGGSEYDRQVRTLISRGSLFLTASGSQNTELGKAFHDISLVSSGLLTDPKFGGLKKDMNILLSQDKLPEDFTSSDQDASLRPYTKEDGEATVSNRPIGSWNQLYYWSNLWDYQNTKDNQDASASLLWDGSTPYTVLASDAESIHNMMNNRYTYMRNPILMRLYAFVGMHFNYREGQHGMRGGHLDFRLSVIPVQVWWNPYNVQMKLQGPEGQPMGVYFGQHRLLPLVLANNATTGGSEQIPGDEIGSYNEAMFTPYKWQADGYNNRQIADFMAALRTTATMNKDGTPIRGELSVLNPGEIVIFAQPLVDQENFSHGVNPIVQSKANGHDVRVDNFPLKEGWSEAPGQATAFAINQRDGMRYDILTGDEYTDQKKFMFSVKFAENTSELQFTPDSVILASKYTDDIKKGQLGGLSFAAGVLDPSKVGQAQSKITKSSGTGADPQLLLKTIPAVLNINWGIWEKPLIDLVKPSQNMIDMSGAPTDNDNTRRRGKGGKPDDYTTFAAYYGVSLKWGKTPTIGTFPADKDYRAKTWQHSSPLYWGSQMHRASDLSRAYHPYQVEFKQATDEFAPVTIGNVLSAEEGDRMSPFGGPGAEQVTKIVAAELPLHQPYSIAGFAGARLTPGWYDDGEKTAASTAKRLSYQSGVPGVGIGNSFADPIIPANQIFSHNEISADPILGDFWDHGFMANDGIWDSWYTSSLSSRPKSISGTGGKTELKDVISEAFSIDENSDQTALANKRFGIKFNGAQAQDVMQELNETDGYKYSAKYLTVNGAFNINSTSIKAWKAILGGLKDRRMLYMNGGAPKELTAADDTTYFSRFAIASNEGSHIDDLGTIGFTNGLPDGEATAWSDLSKITSEQMDRLAEKMEAEVKKRGPFLNMAEFVNRRLEAGDNGIKGALQAAIDNSGINDVFYQMSEQMLKPQFSYPNSKAAEGSVYTAAPGYLIQSDVLAVLGNILTTRDDSFTIRAYGEVGESSTTGDGKVLSRAWCEATVQRTIDYVDPSNSPETPVTAVNYQTGQLEDSGLSQINKTFGRKFEVVSFRWLSAEEI